MAFHILFMSSHGERPVSRLRLAHRVLNQVANVGTIFALLIVATGVINSQLIVGIANLAPAMTTLYGQLLLLKLLFFAAMLVLAAFVNVAPCGIAGVGRRRACRCRP
jgi:putative copper resistance protein D